MLHFIVFPPPCVMLAQKTQDYRQKQVIYSANSVKKAIRQVIQDTGKRKISFSSTVGLLTSCLCHEVGFVCPSVCYVYCGKTVRHRG